MPALRGNNDARARPSDSARFPRESGAGTQRVERVAAVAQLAHSQLVAAAAVAHLVAAAAPHHVAWRVHVSVMLVCLGGGVRGRKWEGAVCV